MKLSSNLLKRIRHDFLPVYIKKHWRETASHMKTRRFLIPQQVATDPSISVLSECEDMFVSRRYQAELAKETEIGMSSEQANELERLRTERVDEYFSSYPDPRTPSTNTLPTLIFSSARLFSKDIAQACMLANAVVRPGLPPGMDSFYKKVSSDCVLDEQKKPSGFDLLTAVEKCVLNAHVWQTDEDRLPKRYNPKYLIWKFKLEFGIHPNRVVNYLFQNLLRLCELQSYRMSYENISNIELPIRWLTRNRLLEAYFMWGGERRIQFAETHDFVLSSRVPSKNFAAPVITEADLRTIAEYKDRLKVISPLIDLSSTRYYRGDNTDGWIGNSMQTYPFPNLFTVNVALPNVWSDFTAPEKDRISVEQRQAVGIMNCLASTMATARRLYGDVDVLPEPISVDAICSDGVFFDFISFQLNSLNFPDWTKSEPDLPNFIWIDGNHRLVDKQPTLRGMLRNTQYKDLDISVFHMILARYLWNAQSINPNNSRDTL